MSPLRWTTKSTRTLADELTRQGHRVSADTVGDLLREEGFSLQANAKTMANTRGTRSGGAAWCMSIRRAVEREIAQAGTRERRAPDPAR